MSNTPGGITRTVALWVMILTAAAADALLYANGQIHWGTFFSFVIGAVIAWEIYAYATKRKTISTLYKDWTIKSPVLARVVLVLLCISLNALILHLAVW